MDVPTVWAGLTVTYHAVQHGMVSVVHNVRSVPRVVGIDQTGHVRRPGTTVYGRFITERTD